MNQIPIIKINEAFRPLYASTKRYYLITGGRGSLKSTTVHDFIARLTFEKGHGVLFTRYTMTSAEKSIIPEFKTCLQRLDIEEHFTITQNMVVNNQTGSFIYFSGIKTSSGNQTANLKSIANITTWVIEEGEDFQDEKAFDAIDDSIRVNGIQNRVIWIQNPSTREHFIYKRWIKDSATVKNYYGYNVTISNNSQVEHIHTTYHIAQDLSYLNPEWIEKANEHKAKAEQKELIEKGAKYRSHYYYNYIGGWLERADGVIFDYTIGQFNELLPVKCCFLDWGYSPDPLAVGQIAIDTRNKKIYVRQKIYATMVNDVGSALDNAGIKKHELIICDTSEPRTKFAVAKLGFNIQNAVKGMIVDDVRIIKQYEIILDPGSNDFKMEFDNYIWNDKKASIPIDKYNHCFVGETLITTNLGQKKIKDIDIYDFVLTSNGYRKVLKKFNNGIKEINKYTFLFDMFSLSLCCTKDHKIKTEKGWMEISKLSTEIIYLHINSMVKNTGYIQTKNTLVGEQKDFILKNSGKQELKQQRNGINQQKELNGIRNTPKDIILVILHLVKEIVISVILNMKPKPKLKNFALINVNHNTEGMKDLTMLKKNAMRVQKNTLPINIISQKLAGVCVERIESQEVYDLMVDEYHEYFANGVLVHNCIDGMRYGFRRLTTVSNFSQAVGSDNLV